jgi:hypothetical protein
MTTFHRLRPQAVAEFRNRMLRVRTLAHQQVYQYKVHLPKLAAMTEAVSPHTAGRINKYLTGVFENFPDHFFQEIPKSGSEQTNSLRSSESHFPVYPLVPTEKQNLASDLVAMGLLLARTPRDRHPSVQQFMLANDSCTIACEVPVYLTAQDIRYYKSSGFFVCLPESETPITGHIDILQARNGFIHLLDYKPNANRVNTVEQLVVYALAIASRARLPIKVFKCAWFDERDYFEFFPLQLSRMRYTPGTRPSAAE